MMDGLVVYCDFGCFCWFWDWDGGILIVYAYLVILVGFGLSWLLVWLLFGLCYLVWVRNIYLVVVLVVDCSVI